MGRPFGLHVLLFPYVSVAHLHGRGTVRENVPTDITDTPSQYWMSAMYLPFVDHWLQEMDTRICVAQSH